MLSQEIAVKMAKKILREIIANFVTAELVSDCLAKDGYDPDEDDIEAIVDTMIRIVRRGRG